MSTTHNNPTEHQTRPGAGRRRHALRLGAAWVLGAGATLGVVLSLTGSALAGRLVTDRSAVSLAAPVLVSAIPADGSLIAAGGLASGTLTYTANKAVTWSNVAFVVPPGAPAAPVFNAPLGTTATATYGSTATGTYGFTATLSDGVNPAVNVAAHFTIAAPAGSASQPETAKSTDPTTPIDKLDSTDGSSFICWLTATFSVPSVVSIQSLISAPTAGEVRPTMVSGLRTSITASAIKVTATTLADGTKVTSFPQSAPLEIMFGKMTAESVPLSSSNGGLTYVSIPLIPGPTLPVGYSDGYWFDAPRGVLHILTTHLTIFAVQRDTQAPSAPRSLTGTIAGDGLTLRWEPASDNSGAIAHYNLFINGSHARSFDGGTFEGKLGPYTPGDTRVFQVRADDSRANIGEPSNAVTLLPDVSKLTPATARGVLIRSGLSVGATTDVASNTPAGTIVRTTPAYPAAVVVGSTVGLALSNGAGITSTTDAAADAPLALKVAGAKRLALRQRKSVALRVVVSAPAKTTITMRSAGGTALASWTRSLQAGATIVTVALPPATRRAGTYAFTVSARPAGAPAAQAIARTTIVDFMPTLTPVAKAVDVVLVNGPAGRLGSSLNLPAKATMQSLPKGPDVYDFSGTKAANVQVVVLDLDTKGAGTVHIVRSLRAVYPDLRIIALASTPSQIEMARREGATVVLTKPVSAANLSAAVTHLIPTATPTRRVASAVGTST